MTSHIEAMHAELDAQVVAHVDGRDVTRHQLDQAFMKVHPPNWKDPIDTVITVADDAELAVIDEAVVFFTGSRCEFNKLTVTNRYRVRAAGYYATCGA